MNQLKAHFMAHEQRLEAAELCQTQYPHLTAKLSRSSKVPFILGPTEFRTPCHTPGFQWATSLGDYQVVVTASQFNNHVADSKCAMKECSKCHRTFSRGTGLLHTGKPGSWNEHTLYWVKGHYLPRNDKTRTCVLCEFKSRMDGWREYIGSESNSDVEEVDSTPKAPLAAKDVEDGTHHLVPRIPPPM